MYTFHTSRFTERKKYFLVQNALFPSFILQWLITVEFQSLEPRIYNRNAAQCATFDNSAYPAWACCRRFCLRLKMPCKNWSCYGYFQPFKTAQILSQSLLKTGGVYRTGRREALYCQAGCVSGGCVSTATAWLQPRFSSLFQRAESPHSLRHLSVALAISVSFLTPAMSE